MIRALLFDFDGVLARTFAYHLRAWRETLGFDPDRLTLKLNEGQSARRIAQALCDKAGRPVDEATACRLANQKGMRFRATQKARVFPQIPTMIANAKDHGLKLALVTGAQIENLRAVLTDSLLEHFDVIVKDGDVPRGKPFPDPFLAAAEWLQLDPGDCLVIENAPLGIESAKSAGCLCIALRTTLPKKYLLQADFILKHHDDLSRFMGESFAMQALVSSCNPY